MNLYTHTYHKFVLSCIPKECPSRFANMPTIVRNLESMIATLCLKKKSSSPTVGRPKFLGDCEGYVYIYHCPYIEWERGL